MKKFSIFDFLVGILIVLIFIVFNPYVFPTLYFDATLSYGFVAGAKISLLAILNIVLIIVWIKKVYREGALLLPPVKIYVAFILWIISIFSSYFFSIDKTSSFYGYNLTLENSLLESILLILFFISFISVFDSSQKVMDLIRYLGIGIGLLSLYTLIRQNINWSISDNLFGNYLNSKLFSPSGNFESIIAIFLCGFLLSSGNLIYNLITKSETKYKVIDIINSSLSLITFFYLLHLGDGRYIQLYYLIVGIIFIGIFIFIIGTNEKYNKFFKHIIGLVLIASLLGIVTYFYGTRPVVPPSVPFEYSWGISIQSLQVSIPRAIFGNGQSTFVYFFDQYKGENIVLPQLDETNIYRTPFKINDQSPLVPELRIHQNSSQMLNILSSQGLFGLIIYFMIYILVVYHSFRKGLLSNGIFPVLTLSSITVLFIGSIFYRYDFILSFLYWFILGLHLIILYEEEPRKALNISLGNDFIAQVDRYRFILPAFSLILTIIFFIYSTPVFVEKFYLYRSKNALIENNITDARKYAQQASLSLPLSAISVREVVQFEFDEIVKGYDLLNEKKRENPKYTETEEYKTRKTNLALRTENILRILSGISELQNLDYKNYYYAGLILTKLSLYNDLAFDSNAEKYLQESLKRNSENPNAYYYLAQIYLRNNSQVNASNYISRAIRILPDNILYLALQADILYINGDYNNALKIYKDIRTFVNSTNNQQLKDIYNNEDIESDIIRAEEKLKSEKKDS